MGWAVTVNDEGRQVGYGVRAECDHGGCTEIIDRGLGHVCGGLHDGGQHGCGLYFCREHLGVEMRGEATVTLCVECLGEGGGQSACGEEHDSLAARLNDAAERDLKRADDYLASRMARRRQKPPREGLMARIKRFVDNNLLWNTTQRCNAEGKNDA